MLKKIFFPSLFLLSFIAKAQVNINVQLPLTGMVQKEQLWNLILINNSEDIVDVYVRLNLMDKLTGQVVLSASSGNILVGKGVKVISSKDIEPLLYNYNSPDFSRSYLPIGIYTACYQVFVNAPKSDPLAEECVQINIDPLSPPLLNLPADKSEIQATTPQFSWMPPTPFDMFNNLNYELLVAEVLPGQAPTEAIQYNTPLFSKANIMQPNELYPASFTKLDTGKLYAWQVTAKNGFSYAAKTDVWTFSIGKENVAAPAAININYILLEDDLKGTYSVTGKKLYIKYASFFKEHDAPIVFSDADGNILLSVNKKIIQGDNYLDIDLNHNFQKGKIYSLTLTDLAGKSQAILFSIN